MADAHIHHQILSDKPLTIAEVAGQLGVSTRTVHRWIKAGRLRAIQLPGKRGRYRINQQDINDALVVLETSA